jgi:hypothetical protein
MPLLTIHKYLADDKGFSIRITGDMIHIHNWDSILAGMILRNSLTIGGE